MSNHFCTGMRLHIDAQLNHMYTFATDYVLSRKVPLTVTPLALALETELNPTNFDSYVCLSMHLYKQVTLPNLTNSKKLAPLEFG